MLRSNRLAILPALLAVLLAASFSAQALAAPSDESDVRAVVQKVFEDLRSGRYDSLYDSLPAASRSRITRERFASALRRSGGMYHLDRLEVGAVRVSGDLAAVDTVMYGSIERPVRAEGKIVAQQYLVREEGRWRVATGDRATVRRFLAANPGFAKKFPLREPRIFTKQDGRWVDVTAGLRAMSR